MIDAIGGRKVLAVLVIVALGVGAVFLKGDVPTNFLELLKWVFPFFIAGNAIEHVVAGSVEKVTSGAPPTIEAGAITPTEPTPQPVLADPYMPRLDHIIQQNEDIKGALAATQQGVSVILQAATRQ